MLYSGLDLAAIPLTYWLVCIAGWVFGLFVLARQKRMARPAQKPRAERRRAAPESEKILHAVARHAKDGLIYQDMQARIIWANDAYCQVMGYELHEILGRRPQEYCFPPDLRPSDEEIENFEFDLNDPEFSELTRRLNIRKNGEVFWQEFNLSLMENDSGEKRVILVSRDVTEQVEREEELERAKSQLHHDAHHDSLTGLQNRAAFLEAAEKVIDDGRALGLMYLDLDKFKAVNDTHGHPAGDAILQHVSHAIEQSVEHEGFACRIGGDEFLVACPDVASLSALEHMADLLRERIVAPVEWDGIELVPSTSIGLATTKGPETTAEDLIRMADFALYESKGLGAPSIMRYDADLHARREDERETTDEFSDILNTDGLEFVFQPIIATRTTEVVGFETLVRWRRKTGEIIGPLAFLKHAATLRRLDEVDLAAARAAAKLAVQLRTAGYSITGAFNSSPETLARPDFLPRLEVVLAEAGLPHEGINVEVLETTFFGHDARGNPAAECISELRESGIKVFLDDFGVGYAGLAHLGQLDISGIKIDQSLTANVVENRAERMIARSIVDLCQELSLEVCAEGIERTDQADLFDEFGCNWLQGYQIARPMSAEALVEWIAARSMQQFSKVSDLKGSGT